VVDYTPYQKGVIRRYYENRDTIALNRLGEIASDLYLAEGETARKRLWRSAAAQLEKLPCAGARRERIVAERDLEGLAKLLGELQG